MSSGVATPARRLAQGCAPSRTRMPPNVQSLAAIRSFAELHWERAVRGTSGRLLLAFSVHIAEVAVSAIL
jgi:hypothetical protein